MVLVHLVGTLRTVLYAYSTRTAPVQSIILCNIIFCALLKKRSHHHIPHIPRTSSIIAHIQRTAVPRGSGATRHSASVGGDKGNARCREAGSESQEFKTTGDRERSARPPCRAGLSGTLQVPTRGGRIFQFRGSSLPHLGSIQSPLICFVFPQQNPGRAHNPGAQNFRFGRHHDHFPPMPLSRCR